MKNLKLAAAALSTCVASSAYALGGTSMDGQPNPTGGDGISGDLVLAAVNGSGTQSLLWDLSAAIPGLEDMNLGGFMDWASTNPGGMFTVNNGTVGSLIDNSWDWHVFAMANNQDATTVTNFGVLTTVDSVVNPATTGTTLELSMTGPANWVINRNVNPGMLTDDGVLTATDSDTWFCDNGLNEHGANIFTTDATVSVGDIVDVQFLSKQAGSRETTFDPVLGLVFGVDDSAISIADIGTFQLFDNGDLKFTAAAPVPVPAAVWLFGSAALGLGSITRRKNV